MFDWDSLRASHSTNGDAGVHEVSLANNSGAVGYLRWDADDGEVMQLFVGEPYRRLGLATHMWELATEWAKERGLVEPEHSSRRSEEGDHFANSIGGYIPRLTDDIDGWSTRHESITSPRLIGQLLIESSDLLTRLNGLRSEFVRVAQGVYDSWQQDEDGLDVEVGSGGVCDEIASEIGGILAMAGIDTVDGGQDGDDHAYLYAYDDRDAFEVDLPHRLYERGSGYSWTKLPGVIFEPSDIAITRVNRGDILDEASSNLKEGLLGTLLEAAVPSELVNKRFYHGCPSRGRAESILRDGICPNMSRTKGFLKPITDKVYLTSDIAYAQIYALGGNIAGSVSGGGLKFEDPDEQAGYVFVVEGSSLTDILPDEDLVGEICARYLQFERGREQEVKFGIRNYYQKYDTPANKNLARLAVSYGTQTVLRRAVEGDMAWVAKLGKQILAKATGAEIESILRVPEAHAVAAHGMVTPSQCWKINKPEDIQRLRPDGSNFFEVATRIR